MNEVAVIDVIVPPPIVIEVTVGTKGDPGPPGPAGAPGGSSSVFFYKIDANATGQSDPGTGKLRYNNASQNLATAFYVDWITEDGFDAHQFFLRTAATTHVVLQDADLAVNSQEWELTGPAINYPDWFEVPVRLVASSGAGRFNHNTRIAAMLISESDPLPTAPIEQVLISQGIDVPPVFSPVLTLATPTPFAPCLSIVNHTFGISWRMSVGTDGDFQIRSYNEAGVRQGPGLDMNPYNGELSNVNGGFSAYNGGFKGRMYAYLHYPLAQLGFAQADVGTLADISDSTTKTPGDIVTGGGAFDVLARWNGTNWIVISG